ncbi:hypothetical protein Gogos_022087 [Gossypium gossypioides]|uniref:Uncharacterized protein n=1 Tax=Gossypium gossypioides TaxID=34282 RepID=A0A7J9D1L4_GOSGO|nr:hypothetical protein [Gossypium gossypioides]
METLVVMAQHRNRYCSKVNPDGPARFGSSPSRNFRGINCRSFHFGAGLLPSPFEYSAAPTDRRLSSLPPPSSSSSSPNTPCPHSKTTMKSSTTLINNNRATKNGKFSSEEISGEGFPYRELWAGPAYSNLPPPSSLPIPKFSLRVKRTVSLDLPAADPFVDVHPTGNSAPASVAELFGCDDSATKTLRRILNLDNTDN